MTNRFQIGAAVKESICWLGLILSILVLWTCDADQTMAGHARDEWRVLTQAETKGDWRNAYKNSAIKTSGDYNGDGKRDNAFLMANKTNSAIGLFVSLGGNAEPMKLEEFLGIAPENVGIKSVPPGSYSTVCGKGYVDCVPNQPTTVTINNDGIELFVFESSHILFFWEQRAQQFRRVWLSD